MASSAYALTVLNAPPEPGGGSAGADEVQGGGAGAVGDDIPSLKGAPGRINLLREAGKFTCFTSAVALSSGLETCGAPMLPSQRLRHIVGSFVMYSSMGLITWLLSYLVFGFSNNVAIGLGVVIFLDFMVFMVPMEQSLWGEPLVGHFLKKHQRPSSKIELSLTATSADLNEVNLFQLTSLNSCSTTFCAAESCSSS